MKNYVRGLAVLLILGVLAACARDALSPTPASVPAPKKGEASTRETGWEALVKAAQKEGTLNIYVTAVPAAARAAVQQAFKQKYGISIEYTPAASGEIVQKVKSEMAAGLYLPDIIHTGATQFINDFKPMNITVPVEPLLVLPEAVDPSKWVGGKLPFIDGDKHGFMVLLLSNNFYMINRDLVKENEITTTTDLLNPKWKGQIGIQDPSVSGNGSDWFAHTLLNVLGMEPGQRFMRDLVKQQPTITRDIRLLAEGVARGKHSLGVGISVAMVVEFIKAGAPVTFATVKEPRPLSPGAGIIYTFKNVPHPNARQLFMNWFATREGSTVYAPAHGYPSTRLDVPTESFVPALIPRQGDIMPDEQYELRKGELMKLAGEVFKDLLR